MTQSKVMRPSRLEILYFSMSVPSAICNGKMHERYPPLCSFSSPTYGGNERPLTDYI